MGQSLPESKPLNHAQQAAFLRIKPKTEYHKTYLDLGVLGEQVEAIAEWKLSIDDDGYVYPEILMIRVIGFPICGALEVRDTICKSKLHDIEEAIKEEAGLE